MGRAAAVLCLSLCAVTPGAAADPPSSARVDACLAGTSELLGQSKFTEAADTYVCAADEMAKLPGGQSRAARYRANAHLYRSWGTYTQSGVTGTFGRANLDTALRHAEQSRALFKEASFPVGEQLATAWHLYLTGVKAGLEGRYDESRPAFEKARHMFVDIGAAVPPIREMTEKLVALAEDQTIFASTMALMSRPEDYQKRGGEIHQRLAELSQRAAPAMRGYYHGLEQLFRAMRLFDEAAARLESWDYQDAGRILPKVKEALREARQGAAALAVESRRGEFEATTLGWSEATNAESHHASALEALFEQGNTGKAKAELIAGVESYRAALAAFEKAGFAAGTSAAIQTTYARLRDRANAVSTAFGPTNAMLGVGKAFFVFFVVTLAVLTVLKRRLKLDGKLILWVTLVVAIIAAFGLKAPDIFNSLKNVPTKIG